MLGSFEDKLCLCDWAAESHRDIVDRRLRKVLKAGYEKSTSDVILEAMSQLDEYFNGERTVFEVPLLFVGTEFQPPSHKDKAYPQTSQASNHHKENDNAVS